jgi:YesN/AraC family two-component response regulator
MSYTILLVDDDSEFREEFHDLLDEYVVIEASNGDSAMEILGKPNEIDLVISDVMMPGIRGTELLKEIKRMYPDMAVIILTGYGSKDIAVKALKGRADDYMEKPLDPRKAKEIIERLLEKKTGSADASLTDLKGKIEIVKRFAERNYDKKVSLDDAARKVYLSPKYLSRVFKEVTGKGFSRYRLEVKTHRAGKLLRDTGYTVSQISEELGYQNPESFIRIFKRMAGCTPTEYRKRFKKKQ